MADAGHCIFCGSEINPDNDYQYVSGWEKHRQQGGTNALRGREPHPDKWGCRWCVDKIAKGLTPGQGALL